MAKTLENYLDELGAIADKMNSEDIGLEEAMGLYKKGGELAAKAEKILDKFEKELEIAGDEEDMQ